MLTYTPKYGIYDNKMDDLLKRSNFTSDKGPAFPPYKTLVDIESDGIWFISKYHWSDTNSWCNIWIDNWGGIWKMAGSIHSSGGEIIRKEHEGFSKPMPDICIENIISNKWPIPTTPQTVTVSNALKAYVSMFLEIDYLKNKIILLRSIHDSEMEEAGEDIARLDLALEEANAELAILKFTEPVNIVSELESIDFNKTTTTEEELLKFSDTKSD